VDYFEGGAHPVPDASFILHWIERLRLKDWDMVVHGMTWASSNSVAFVSNNPGAVVNEVIALAGVGSQAMVPEHCVQGTPGAALHPDLRVGATDLVVHLGTGPMVGVFSMFRDSDKRSASCLPELIAGAGIDEVFVCGLPVESAVQHTALDARIMLTRARGVYVIKEACKGFSASEAHKVFASLSVEGIQVISATDDRITAMRDWQPEMIPVLPAVAMAPGARGFTADATAALFAAVRARNPARVTAALEAGAEPGKRIVPQGLTALHAACTPLRHGENLGAQLAIVRTLTTRPGAEEFINVATASVRVGASAGETALQIACASGRAAIVAALLDAGAAVDICDGLDRLNPLMVACLFGHADVVAMLVEAGCRVDMVTKFHKTALMYALGAAAGLQAATRCLKALSSKWDPAYFRGMMSRQDVEGWAPIHYAAKSGVLSNVPWRLLLTDKFLSDMGTHLVTTGKHTALHIAVWNKQDAVVDMLLHKMRGFQGQFTPLAHNLKRNAAADGRTALDLAMIRGDRALIRTLLHAGCFARSMAGERCDEELEHALLEFDVPSVECLLRWPQNNIHTEWHIAELLMVLRYRSTCTFSFAGFSNPMRQHLFHCSYCEVDVCLICAEKCHAHAGRGRSVSRVGLAAFATVCGCVRHMCLAVEGVDRRDGLLTQYTPHPITTEHVSVVIYKGVVAPPARHNSVSSVTVEAFIRDADAAATAAASVRARAVMTVEELDSIVVALACHHHSLWAADRCSQGWVYGPELDRPGKRHPLLRPFSQLKPSDQQSNRDDVWKMLRLILAFRYEISAPPAFVAPPIDFMGDAENESSVALFRAQTISYSNTSLAHEHLTLCEVLARNIHEEWALKQIELGIVFGTGGKCLRQQLRSCCCAAAHDVPGTP
jgi:nicotinamidase/pyrazinamidase